MTRIAILGNSGSGKSTLARWLSTGSGAALLDLDLVAWEPGQIAVPRPRHLAEQAVRDFCTSHDRWILEGCYADLVQVALEFRPLLLFMNPGEEQCLQNCRSRPFEPHKYAAPEEQMERLPFLLDWVRAYPTRAGPMGFQAHRACVDGYDGRKHEVTRQLSFDDPDPGLQAWLQP